MEEKNKIIIYKPQVGNVELRIKLDKETVWLNQEQIAQLFAIERSVITKHLRNIFNSRELKKSSVCAFFAHTAKEKNGVRKKWCQFYFSVGGNWGRVPFIYTIEEN